MSSRRAFVRTAIAGTGGVLLGARPAGLKIGVVAEGPGEPARSKVGPIGLQLHDRFSNVMFRNIRIRKSETGLE